jgi:hypothetical protein
MIKFILYLILPLLSACSIIKFSDNNKNDSVTINTLSIIPDDWVLLKISDYKIYFSALDLMNIVNKNNSIYFESTKNSIDSLFKKQHLRLEKINDSLQTDDSEKIEFDREIECWIDDLLKNENVYIEDNQGRIEKIKYTIRKPKTYGGIFSEWSTLEGLIINRVLLAIAIY